MKILVLGSRIPWPLRDGGAIATYQLLQGLAEQGAEVVYFSFNTRKHFVTDDLIREHFSFCRVMGVPLDANPTILGALKALFRGENYNIARFDNTAAKNKLKHLLSHEKFDLVQLEGLYASPFLDVVMEKDIPVSLRQHNAEFQIWERLAVKNRNPIKRLYFGLLAAQLKRYEISILNKVDAIIPITAADWDLFAVLAPGKEMVLLPVGLNNLLHSKPDFQSNTFFHLGSMEWIPNVDAVMWLIKEVWPQVKTEIPAAELHLAGKGLKADDPRFAGNGVVVHGEVENAQGFMQSHGVMLVPVFAAGGIRVKTLEAFNAGVPVISTATGIQGIEATHEKELLIANTPKEFGNAMIRMQNEPLLRETIVENARALIAKNYKTEQLISGLLRFYEDLVKKSD
jgi:glycosyltransferase involved in cell wall biosynthesis